MIGTYTHRAGQVHALLEVIEPPISLVVFGAGWDAIPMAAAGKALGWRVIVVDHRAGHAKPERFAMADQVIVCRPDEVSARVPIDDRTAAILMTHQYPDDLGYLRAALESNASYIGLLGPAKRRDRLLHDLREVEHYTPELSRIACIRGPVGLDIGAENAPEIAAAVTAEIIAVRAGRTGMALKHRDAPIHDPVVAAAITPEKENSRLKREQG